MYFELANKIFAYSTALYTAKGLKLNFMRGLHNKYKDGTELGLDYLIIFLKSVVSRNLKRKQ